MTRNIIKKWQSEQTYYLREVIERTKKLKLEQSSWQMFRVKINVSDNANADASPSNPKSRKGEAGTKMKIYELSSARARGK